MYILSLCDGIASGRLALDKAGIKVDAYYASEIKKIAIDVAKDNYPDIIELGDVRNIKCDIDVLKYKLSKIKIDMIMFGSPCQTLSNACRSDRRIGLKDMNKSGIFYYCYKILKTIKPKYFLVENVASMKDEDKNIITEMLGVEPICINSKDLLPAMRKRLYWTNIKVDHPIQPRNIKLQDILASGYTEKEKARCLMAGDSRPHITPIKMIHRYFNKCFTTLIFKDEEHYKLCREFYDKYLKGLTAKDIDIMIKDNKIKDLDILNGVRYMNKTELERCQGLPQGYTKILSRNNAANVIGDGWSIDVITHILKGIKREDNINDN